MEGMVEEDEDIYDEDNEDEDDADALSSSPSIPDDVHISDFHRLIIGH